MLASGRGGRTSKSVTWPEHGGEGLVPAADADEGLAGGQRGKDWHPAKPILW